jgi:hypothetical protein
MLLIENLLEKLTNTFKIQIRLDKNQIQHKKVIINISMN